MSQIWGECQFCLSVVSANELDPNLGRMSIYLAWFLPNFLVCKLLSSKPSSNYNGVNCVNYIALFQSIIGQILELAGPF